MKLEHIKYETPREITASSARGCYSKRFIKPEECIAWYAQYTNTDDLLKDLFIAEHNTTQEHFYMSFMITGVSRHFVWRYLHGLHPFYSSDQQSQRYVKMNKENFYYPNFLSENDRLEWENYYETCYNKYEELNKKLESIMEDNNLLNPHLEKRKDKKAMEFSRYVLPLGQTTFLTHTLNFVTILRLYGYLNTLNENDEIIEEAKEFSELLRNELLSLGDKTIDNSKIFDEYRITKINELKNNLENAININSEEYEINKIKNEILKFEKASYSEIYKEVINILFTKSVKFFKSIKEYEKNYLIDYENIFKYLKDKNTSVHVYAHDFDSINNTGIERTNSFKFNPIIPNIDHLNIFKSKILISHSADSQNQRHRMTEGVRYPLKDYFDKLEEKYYFPHFLKINNDIENEYKNFMEYMYNFFEKQSNKYGFNNCLYLLPNSQKVFFMEIDKLSYFSHKAQKRLCYNSQEEIFHMTQSQVLQLEEKGLNIYDYDFVAPCSVNYKYKIKPTCPEGDRFCGIQVWKIKEVENYKRII